MSSGRFDPAAAFCHKILSSTAAYLVAGHGLTPDPNQHAEHIGSA